MSTEHIRDDRIAVDEPTAARLIGFSASTLRRWRRQGTGPRSIRVSRVVRYRRADLERFIASFDEDAVHS